MYCTGRNLHLHYPVARCLPAQRCIGLKIAYILTGLLAGRFTRQITKPAGESIGLVDAVDALASQPE